MTEISASLVKELREETNVGMMECKRALVEAGGDKTKAVKILRERGMAIADKKASRAANQGVIVSAIADQGKIGSLIEVNCETDFVAKNEGFKAFVQKLAEKAATMDGSLADAVQTDVKAKIAEIGENIIVRRNIRFVVQGTGMVGTYIHHGSTVGVMLELGCQKAETCGRQEFKDLAKDICLHITANNPQFADRTKVTAEVAAAEREIYAKQVVGKPANIIEKIVDGKMGKFYEQVCLVDQPFVKDQEKRVSAVIQEKEKVLGDTITIGRYVRFQMGEAI